MKKKQLIMVAVLLFGTLHASAQGTLKPANVSVAQGQEAELTVLTNLDRKDFRTIQMDIVLPAGVTLKQTDGNPVATVTTSGTDHTAATRTKEETSEGNSYRLLVYSGTNAKLAQGLANLADLTVVADKRLANGTTLQGKLTGIVLSYKDGTAPATSVTPGDVTFNIKIDNTATGVDAVSADDTATGSDARYNLSGQRVGNDYRGVVIENGKKKIVK